MSIVFFILGVIFPFTILSAMALSVCIGVGGCGWPISSRMILMNTAYRAMMCSPASSASVVDVMTCLIICAMLRTAPLFGGIAASFDKKK